MHKEPIATYLRACENESWVDVTAVERAGRNIKPRWLVPRVHKMLQLIRNDILVGILGLLLNALWPLLFVPLILMQALRWSRRTRRRREPQSRQTKVVWLAFSGALLTSDNARLIDPPDVIVLPASNSELAEHAIAVSAWTTPTDYVWAILQSVKSMVAHLSNGSWHRVSQTYTAFDWFMSLRALERMIRELNPETLVFANHYDRWAVMFAGLGREAQKIMIQHGVLPDEPLPNKIGNIDLVLAFSARSEEKFRNNVLLGSNGTAFKIAGHHLELSDIADQRGPSVLIVGDPLRVEKDLEIAESLQRTGEVGSVFVKPHPKYPSIRYQSLRSIGVSVIEEEDFFPRVDCCVASASTLGHRYEAAGVLVIWHGSHTVSEVREKVLEAVN